MKTFRDELPRIGIGIYTHVDGQLYKVCHVKDVNEDGSVIVYDGSGRLKTVPDDTPWWYTTEQSRYFPSSGTGSTYEHISIKITPTNSTCNFGFIKEESPKLTKEQQQLQRFRET